MEGLYVAGEDAGGAHGSNRLGGNGVANSTVFGGIAGDVMGQDVSTMSLRDPDDEILKAEHGRAVHPLGNRPGAVHPIRETLQNAMWDHVGVLRDADGMQKGLDAVAEVRAEMMETGVDDANLAFNLTWHDWLNLASLCDVSEAIAKSGLARENSRGAHYRTDFPDEGDIDSSYFTVIQNGDVTRQPVLFTKVRPGESLLSVDEPESLVETT